MKTETPDRRAPAREQMTALYARIPERLVERLREEAADQRRSPSAQLEVLLEERYADAPAAPQAA